MNFPDTRDQALARLHKFVRHVGRYSSNRNHVIPHHGNVSCLSAAIRHRLLTEWEVAEAPLTHYAASTVEKFTQEVYWRTYWKGWLSLRPQVWDDYLEGIEEHPDAEEIRQGKGPVAVMNRFARELVETGYLHNHSRMWFAAYWVHVARLPWQLGAKFFQDHLLDFDPASNTLSWRWVAGLQTPGKTYLPRRTNIEKYVAPELLDPHGLELLENPNALMPGNVERPEVTRPSLPEVEVPSDGRVLWIHEEDLNPESSPLGAYRPSRIVVTGEFFGKSKIQKEWLKAALDDVAGRAGKHYDASVEQVDDLIAWVGGNGEAEIVAMRPEVGPLHDRLGSFNESGLKLSLVVRPEDRYLRSLARSGFFGFWKKLRSRMASGEFPASGQRELF
ncbi:MAG: FAD-binding domain-containing protein [Akkermansiaceae bacterium]|nr:FAD-binding domain-containing protein [Akkermansiaceae bacterium]